MLVAAPGTPSLRGSGCTETPGPAGGGPTGLRYSVTGITPWPSMRTEMFSPSMMNRSSTGSFFAALSRLSICANDSSPTLSAAMSELSPARASGSTPSIT